MPPNQSDKIEQLFHAARALPVAERAAYLAVHCASDDEARQAVERLLRGHEAAGDFLETPAVNALPGKLSGRRLAHYQLLSLLGKGGMGEVYLAEDTRLHRKVALKLLPAHFTSEADRVRRFEREAIAASGLNHPNILTVYEISQEQDTHYIATEYIAGRTLRQRLSEGRLPLRTALDIAVQTASALVAAHEAGIIHRDIKPENVMLRSDGLVKVLDFGLAKLTETRKAERRVRSEEAATLLQDAPVPPQLTDPGTVMGTASYMSPEQARGQEVDARSDIFSLGVMLYEMLAGRAPFAGVNPIDVLGAILHQEPVPLNQLVTNLPAELQRIVNKALRKERNERYQHSNELWLDLNDLRRELEFEEKLKARQFPTTETNEPIASTPAPEISDERLTESVLTQPTVSSAKIILGEIKRHKAGAAMGLTLLLVGVFALAYGLYRFAAPKQNVARFQNVKFTQLTTLSNADYASISPDGKFIAYVLQEEGKNSLWTKSIAAGGVVQLVPPTDVNIGFTIFSPDSNYVYYFSNPRGGERQLYQISVLGGAPKRALINSLISFSPDGKQITFMRVVPEKNLVQMVVANPDGSGERVLTERALMLVSGIGPVWSPDGETIAIASYTNLDHSQATVLGITVKTGEIKPLTDYKWSRIGKLIWLGGNDGLALIAQEESAPNAQLWQLSLPSGEVRRVTNELQDYSYTSLSLTADARTLAAIQKQTSSGLFQMSTGSSNQAQAIKLRDNKLFGAYGVSWTPDGRIVYVSTASGNYDLWITNGDGSNPRQLTDAAGIDEAPVVSPDGRYIVYNSTRSGKENIWRMDLDGGNQRQLTFGEVDRFPYFSPDGRWIVYDSITSGAIFKLWKVPIEGGSPVQLTEGHTFEPAVSPDGQWIACFMAEKMIENRIPKVAIFPFAGGAPSKMLEAPLGIRSLRWSPDGRSLFFRKLNQENLWRLPLDGSPAQPITDFKNEQIWSFDVSRDGRQFIIARGTTNSDVVLITEVK